MNFFYEKFPKSVEIDGKSVRVITDFRDYIRLLDMIKDPELMMAEKVWLISQYFLDDIRIDEVAVSALTRFVIMQDLEDERKETEEGEEGEEEEASSPSLFSYSVDYPYILSGFLRDYGIDLETVDYLHWWKFRMLFDGLSDDTEIKQRIMYRGIDLSTIKDKDERKRIARIQHKIRLPQEALTDYDIGNAFA